MQRDQRTELALRGAEITERLYALCLHGRAFGDTAAIQRALSDELHEINARLGADCLPERAAKTGSHATS